MDEQETWNMASATLKRFDNLLRQSSFMAQTKNLLGWFDVIMDLRRNLIPFMTEIQFNEIEEKLRSLPRGWRGFNGKISPRHFAVVGQTLDEVYMSFITIMKKKGLLMPKSIDAGKAVIDMG